MSAARRVQASVRELTCAIRYMERQLEVVQNRVIELAVLVSDIADETIVGGDAA